MRVSGTAGAGAVAVCLAAASCATRGVPVAGPGTPSPDVRPATDSHVAEVAEAPARLPAPAADPVMLDLMRATRKAFAALDVAGYRVVVEGTEARARSVAERTVEPVAARLSKQYFVKAPRDGVRLVLFASDETYRTGAKALTGDEPDTPFGFYSSELSAVIMNLATGGGTLVHEMVHTYTETDFPDCPAWYNEGLASLYEQCRFEPARLVGLTNWRLPALQETLRDETPREDARPARGGGLIAGVVGSSTREFYGPRSGLNYAVARYLCFDLQERGLLERFYREFRRDRGEDPTGRKTLEKLIGRTLEEYEPVWRERTLGLRFPERPPR